MLCYLRLQAPSGVGEAPQSPGKQTVLRTSELSKNFVCFNIVPKSGVVTRMCVRVHERMCLLLRNVRNEVSEFEALKALQAGLHL